LLCAITPAPVLFRIPLFMLSHTMALPLIDELSLDNANYLNYHTVRFYDEDKKTLLDKQYVAYGQSFAYAGSYRRALPDDTGSYTIEGWSLYGSSTLLDSSFFDEDYGNHDLVAKWKTVANSDLYTIDATSGVLTFNGTDGIGSLKVPSTFSDVTVTSVEFNWSYQRLNGNLSPRERWQRFWSVKCEQRSRPDDLCAVPFECRVHSR
jgi:hypothetical protein